MSEYAIYGTNTYLEETTLKKILEEERIEKGQVTEIDASPASFNIDAALTSASMVSLFGGTKKAVILKNPYFLRASERKKTEKKPKGKKEKKTDTAREHLIEVLTAYLKNPSPDTVLVFYLEGCELDTRKKEAKVLSDAHIRMIPCQSIKYWEFPKHISELLKKEHITMTPDARKEFDLRIGTDEYQLHQAIEKMKLYGESHYDLYTISHLIPEDTNLDIWKLGNAVLKGDLKGMLQAEEQALDKGQNVMRLIPLLSSQMIRAYDVLCFYERGYDQASIAARLHVKENAVRMNLQNLYRRSADDLLQMMMRLAETEQGIKAGKKDPKESFDRFLLSCQVR